MTYRFIPKKVESPPPTIQERFVEIYYEQDHTLDFDTRYHLACNTFTEAYKLQPPYTSSSSFKVIMSNRIKYGDRS